MPPAPLHASGHFSLGIVAGKLARYRPPEGPFDPLGNWQLVYGVYTIAGGPGSRVGQLRLKRTADGEDRFALGVDYDKLTVAACRQRVAAQVECRSDRLATARRWTWTSRLMAPPGRPVANTVLRKTATVEAGQLVLDDGRTKRRRPAPTALALHWALWEAVSRLPRRPCEPIGFTLVDDFDLLKPDQTLAYRKSAEVPLGGKDVDEQTLRLHAFDQVGWGIVPWVYWVDDAGRPLVVVSGQEAYLLETCAAS